MLILKKSALQSRQLLVRQIFHGFSQTHHSFRKKVFFKDQENLLSDPLKILTNPYCNFLSKFDSFQGILLHTQRLFVRSVFSMVNVSITMRVFNYDDHLKRVS